MKARTEAGNTRVVWRVSRVSSYGKFGLGAIETSTTSCTSPRFSTPCASSGAAQARASDAEKWEVPRTPDGHPDLQGNWTNQTLTPLQRRESQEGPVYTPEEVARIEQGSVDRFVRGEQPSDPNRAAPPTGQGVGAYNNVYFEFGYQVAVVNGEPRTSLITFPSNGRIPPFTPEGERRIQESRDFKRQFGEYDHPEIRPIAERCLVSYGSPAGPPMLPTTGYNSNYTIV